MYLTIKGIKYDLDKIKSYAKTAPKVSMDKNAISFEGINILPPDLKEGQTNSVVVNSDFQSGPAVIHQYEGKYYLLCGMDEYKKNFSDQSSNTHLYFLLSRTLLKKCKV